VLGYKVTAVDTGWFGKGPAAKDVHRLLIADIRTVDKDVFVGQDAVIDVAGISNDASSEIAPEMTEDINVKGGVRIATMAFSAGVKRYVYSSSASVYGHGAKDNLTEEDDVDPLTAYARSKISVEIVLRQLASDTFKTVVLRNATVFGLAPRMRFDLVVNRMTAEAWQYKVIKVEGGGAQQRPLIHVADAAQVFWKALDDDFPPGTYNVGHQKMNYRIRDIAAVIADFTGARIVYDEQGGIEERNYHLCFDKIAKYFDSPVSVLQGASQIWNALETGRVRVDDETTHTLRWYKHLIKLNGGPL